MEFKVGDLVTAINTFRQNGMEICSNKIYNVVDIGAATDDLRIVLDNGITWWVPGDKMRIVILAPILITDIKKEFKIGQKIKCIETHDVPLARDENILKGETFEVTATDPGSRLNIRISGINNHKEWWSNSKYFEILKEEKDVDKKVEFKRADKVTINDKMMEFKVGDVVVSRLGKIGIVDDVDPGSSLDIHVQIGSSFYWVSSHNYVHATLADCGPKGLPVFIKIKDVIFNDPATIVFWEDGTKTIVKCQKGEKFDPEKGLAIAISKRCLGNSYCWHKRFMKWLPKEEKNLADELIEKCF